MKKLLKEPLFQFGLLIISICLLHAYKLSKNEPTGAQVQGIAFDSRHAGKY